MDDRYQHKPWWIKLWRCRHYLRVPLDVLMIKFYSNDEMLKEHAWSVAIGTAQIHMKYYYTLKEVRSRHP